MPNFIMRMCYVVAAFLFMPHHSRGADAQPTVIDLDLGRNNKLCWISWAAYLPDGRHLAVQTAEDRRKDSVIFLIDAAKKTVVAKAEGGAAKPISGGRHPWLLDPKSEWVGYGLDKSVEFLAIPSAKPPKPLKTPHSWISADLLGLQDDGKQLILAHAGLLRGYTVYRNVIGDPLPEKPIIEDNDVSTEVATLDDRSQHFAAAVKTDNDEYELHVWDLAAKPKRTVLTGESHTRSMAFFDNAKSLAVGYGDGTVAIWDLKTKERSKKIQVGRMTVSSVAVDPSNKLLACATYDSGDVDNLLVVSLESGKIVARYRCDAKGVYVACFSPAGTEIAALGGSGKVKIYDVRPLLKLEKE